MRRELEEIQNIERYLEGKMSGSELSSFETKLNSDVALQQEVANQGVIVERINTMGKMEAMDIAHENHTRKAAIRSWVTKGVIGATAVTAAIVGGKELADLNNGTPSGTEEVFAGVELEDGVHSSDELSNDTKMYQPANGSNSGSHNNVGHSTEDGGTAGILMQDDTTKVDTAAAKIKEVKEDVPPKKEKKESTKKTDGFRVEGVKMFLVSDDEHAKIHFEREVSIYDTWSFVDSEEAAAYKIKLRYKKEMLDRVSWIEIIDIKSGDRVFRSLQSKALHTGMRTVNMKQASIERLVHEILAHEFFGMEKYDY